MRLRSICRLVLLAGGSAAGASPRSCHRRSRWLTRCGPLRRQKEHSRLAMDVPEALYSFKPIDTVRTFGCRRPRRGRQQSSARPARARNRRGRERVRRPRDQGRDSPAWRLVTPQTVQVVPPTSPRPGDQHAVQRRQGHASGRHGQRRAPGEHYGNLVTHAPEGHRPADVCRRPDGGAMSDVRTFVATTVTEADRRSAARSGRLQTLV